MTNVLLVHGAWCDGSSWSEVVPLLQDDGHDVVAVQLPLSSLADDTAVVRRALAALPGPIVVAGHSYGGAVITAAAGHEAVQALVYVAAYAPEAGESVQAVGDRYPATAGAATIRADDQGWLTLAPDSFPDVFAADVPRRTAAVLAAVQAPTHASCFATPLGTPAWQGRRCFYLRSENDRMVHPDAQEAMAKRMGADLTTLPSSHAAPVSHAPEVAAAIHAAARAV